MKINTTKDFGVDRIKMLIVGEPGSGKTTLAGTIKEPTLVISAEAGLLVLKDKEIDVIDISTDDEGKVIPEEKRIDRLKDVYKFLLTKEAQDKYKWIFIDSITEINENLIASLHKKYPEKKDILKLFGDNAKVMKEIIKSYRDIPFYNVVFTCLVTNDQNDDGQVMKKPMLSGKIKDSVAAFFDEVFLLFTIPDKDDAKADRRKLLTGAHNNVHFTKDRSGRLNLAEDPDLQKIADKINQKQPKK